MFGSLGRAVLCVMLGTGGHPADAQVVRPEPALALPPLCGQVRFTLTSPATVIPDYTNSTCGANALGLAVTKFGAMGWSDRGGRVLTIPVRIWNRGKMAIQLPVRLELPVNGKTVLVPADQPRSRLVPLNMDSTLANGRTLWLIGGSGTLAGGDSSIAVDLKFQIDAPVTMGQLRFVGAGEEIVAVPAVAPDSQPAWALDDSSYSEPGKSGFLKGVIKLIFKHGTSLGQRQSAVDAVGGVVIGGIHGADPEATYLIRVPDDGSGDRLRAAVAVLDRQPGVYGSGLYAVVVPFNRSDTISRVAVSDTGVGEAIPPFPMVPPDSSPAWFRHDSSYTGTEGHGILKHAIVVEFQPAATASQREAAVAAINGVVIGGLHRSSGGEGLYYIRVADRGTGVELRAAVNFLLQQTQVVAYANLIVGSIRFFRSPAERRTLSAEK